MQEVHNYSDLFINFRKCKPIVSPLTSPRAPSNIICTIFVYNLYSDTYSFLLILSASKIQCAKIPDWMDLSGRIVEGQGGLHWTDITNFSTVETIIRIRHDSIVIIFQKFAIISHNPAGNRSLNHFDSCF